MKDAIETVVTATTQAIAGEAAPSFKSTEFQVWFFINFTVIFH